MANNILFPDWNNSILNVAATFSNYLGVPNNVPNIRVLEEELKKKYKNVVFIIFDGMGMNVLNQHLSSDDILLKQNKTSITSTLPSTTATATRTLMTAKKPIEHGWLGWSMYFKQHDKVVEIFSGKDFYTREKVLEPNFIMENFPITAFYCDKNVSKDIDVYTCFPQFVDVGISKHHFIANEPNDLFTQIKNICNMDGKKFVYCYNGQPDNDMHKNGVSSDKTKKAIRYINDSIEKLHQDCPDTLFVITADHGHIDILGSLEIYKDKALMDCLKTPISIETRFACFNIKRGMKNTFKKLFSKYNADFELFRSADLIKRGFFGETKNHHYQKFLGDYIAIGKGTNKMISFFNGMRDNRGKYLFRGVHSGFTKEEMQVPLILISKKVNHTSLS